MPDRHWAGPQPVRQRLHRGEHWLRQWRREFRGRQRSFHVDLPIMTYFTSKSLVLFFERRMPHENRHRSPGCLVVADLHAEKIRVHSRSHDLAVAAIAPDDQRQRHPKIQIAQHDV